MRCRGAISILGVAALLVGLPSGRAADPFLGADPLWNLLHEPAVARDLGLTPAKQREVRGLLDDMDAKFFPLRNQPPAASLPAADALVAETMRRLDGMLSPEQLRRITEIGLRQRGPAALVQPMLAERLRTTPRQRERLEAVLAETLAATRDLEKRLAGGEPREPLDEAYRELKVDELLRVSEILAPAQRTTWRKAIGADFDFAALGRPVFKAPALVDSGAWVNSEPLTLEALAGKVVVVHFYAFSCSNCIRNYPTYVAWQERFRDQDVVILGVHTPETPTEEDVERVRQKAEEAGFRFPVLVDRTKANWDAWGNSMWPSVYLIDKRGYLRHFWPGELKWQGATGDAWMQDRIEELLAEPAAADADR
jgi:peroxiredoxin